MATITRKDIVVIVINDKNKRSFLFGQTKVDRLTKEYTIYVRRKGRKIFVIVGFDGVYVLTREQLEEICDININRILNKPRKRKPRKSRKNDKIAVYPNVITEDDIKNYLKSKNYNIADASNTFLELNTIKSKQFNLYDVIHTVT